MMKRFQLLGVAVLALFAFGAILATAASAQTFLLAEWLVGGVAVTTELLAEGTGELLLEDTALKVMILCSGIGDGWVGPNSLYFVSEVLSLSGGALSETVLSGTPLLCVAQEGCSSTAETPNVWAVNMPYEGEVVLMEDGGSTFFAALLLPHAGGGAPGWVVECTILGVKSEDECKTTESVVELKLEGSTLLAVDSESFTELAGIKLGTCSFAGGATGILEGEGTIVLSGGGELTASSEGVVS